MEPRRIALVSLHTSPLDTPGTGDAGGMNVVVVGLADALTAAGHHVEVLTRATGAGRGTGRTPGGATVRFVEAGPRASVAKGELPSIAAEFGDRMLELPPFDLVHSHYWLSGAAALPVAREWGVPHVQSLHTVAAEKNARLAAGDSPEPLVRLEGERMLVHASELTVTSSAAERDAILDAYAAPADRARVVAPGVDTALFHPLEALGPAVDPRRPVLLVLARIQPLKGVDLAIEALALLLREEEGGDTRSRPRLVVAGGTSPGHEAYAAELRRRVGELGLAEDVTFLPARSRRQAAELLRQAELLLVPSHSETFGLVALEAAASGTPVVAARTGGLVDAVADGVSGVLLADRRPSGWAAAVRDLLHRPGRLEALSRSAAAHGAARSWPVAAQELEHLTEGLVADPTAIFGERPVFVHAHPDDESISTGGTLAALLEAGRRPVVVTGTRGERGEVVPGELHHLEGTAALAPQRERELAAALRALGGLPQRFLAGYSDSGMRWGDDGFAVAADDAAADALSTAPLDEVVSAVVAEIEALGEGRPTSIVSYDALGGYGHPDHVRMHEAARTLAHRLDVPFFAIVEPRVEPDGDGTLGDGTLGDGTGVIAVRLSPTALARKVSAMAAHETQLTVAGEPPSFTLSGGQTHPVATVERYRPVR